MLSVTHFEATRLDNNSMDLVFGVGLCSQLELGIQLGLVTRSTAGSSRILRFISWISVKGWCQVRELFVTECTPLKSALIAYKDLKVGVGCCWPIMRL